MPNVIAKAEVFEKALKRVWDYRGPRYEQPRTRKRNHDILFAVFVSGQTDVAIGKTYDLSRQRIQQMRVKFLCDVGASQILLWGKRH